MVMLKYPGEEDWIDRYAWPPFRFSVLAPMLGTAMVVETLLPDTFRCCCVTWTVVYATVVVENAAVDGIVVVVWLATGGVPTKMVFWAELKT